MVLNVIFIFHSKLIIVSTGVLLKIQETRCRNNGFINQNQLL
jgi:hypothetical protein